MAVSKRIVLRFPQRMVERPLTYHLIKDFDLQFSILKAFITPEKEGLMVLEIKGSQKNYDNGVRFLIKNGVKIESLSQDVTRNEERCVHCGACITICPAGAFELDPATKKVNFNNEKCLTCGLCLKACPTRAMEVHF